jgi:uncharacterized RDD family membrane protein YckC
MEYQPDSTPLQPSGARCAQHVETPAAIICSRCGSYACSRCRQWGPNGEDFCATCTPFQPELAERGSRFLANLVDQFLLVVPFLGALFIGGMASAASEMEDSDAAVGVMLLVGMLLTVGVMGLQLYMVSQSGQSIGKRMVGIKVVRTDGSPVSLGRLIFLRNVIPNTLGAMCNFFSLADAVFIFNEDRCCLHDKMADTIVVKVDGGSR